MPNEQYSDGYEGAAPVPDLDVVATSDLIGALLGRFGASIFIGWRRDISENHDALEFEQHGDTLDCAALGHWYAHALEHQTFRSASPLDDDDRPEGGDDA